jgi:hypothetical protein
MAGSPIARRAAALDWIAAPVGFPSSACNGLHGSAASSAARRPGGELPFIMGQFMIFKRSALTAIGGLESAEGQLVDDMCTDGSPGGAAPTISARGPPWRQSPSPRSFNTRDLQVARTPPTEQTYSDPRQRDDGSWRTNLGGAALAASARSTSLLGATLTLSILTFSMGTPSATLAEGAHPDWVRLPPVLSLEEALRLFRQHGLDLQLRRGSVPGVLQYPVERRPLRPVGAR